MCFSGNSALKGKRRLSRKAATFEVSSKRSGLAHFFVTLFLFEGGGKFQSVTICHRLAAIIPKLQTVVPRYNANPAHASDPEHSHD